jgi:hypothetical protein
LKSATQSEKPTAQLKSSATKTETQNPIEIFCNKKWDLLNKIEIWIATNLNPIFMSYFFGANSNKRTWDQLDQIST